MVFRVSGKLPDSQTFTARIDADTPFAAISNAQSKLSEQGVNPSSVLQIGAAPIKSGKAIHIGKARGRKTASAAPAATPAHKGKPSK